MAVSVVAADDDLDLDDFHLNLEDEEEEDNDDDDDDDDEAGGGDDGDDDGCFDGEDNDLHDCKCW